MIPPIDLIGTGAKYVISDYRICSNGSILLSLVNQITATNSIRLSAPGLLPGKTVEDLTRGGILQTNPDGTVNLSLIGDEFVLLYVYPSRDGKDESLVNSNPAKIWFDDAPTAVWPRGTPYAVQVGYDTRGADLTLFASIESVKAPYTTYGQSSGASVTGKGTRPLQVPIPDADLNDPEYISTPDGGEYVFHAWLERDGARLSEVFLPVRLLWGVRPLFLPPSVRPGSTYPISVEWEEIPSYAPDDPTPLGRGALWDSLSTTQHYNLVLELIGGGGQVLASATNITSEGSGTNFFSITVPTGAQGPFSWAALLQTAPQTKSLDVYDSFEGRDRGEDRSPMYPWFSYVYPDPPGGVFNPVPGGVTKLGEGILHDPQTGTNKAAYMVVTNAPAPGVLSGFGIVRGTNDWELPADTNLWSNYVFSCDFKEIPARACILQLQVKDADRNWIEFNKTNAGPGRWDTIKASLDQFVLPGPNAMFDRTRIREFVVNVHPIAPACEQTQRIETVAEASHSSAAIARPAPNARMIFRIGTRVRISPASIHGRLTATTNQDIMTCFWTKGCTWRPARGASPPSSWLGTGPIPATLPASGCSACSIQNGPCPPTPINGRIIPSLLISRRSQASHACSNFNSRIKTTQTAPWCSEGSIIQKPTRTRPPTTAGTPSRRRSISLRNLVTFVLLIRTMSSRSW